MSWKNKLRAASFRGVKFKVSETSVEVGRRGVTHEFPGRDEPQGEDLGRKAQTFTVQAFVLGADYMAARDELIKACEKEGPGELVHPFLGKKNVFCFGGCRVDESITGEGGIARLTITFTEAGKAVFPKATQDTGYGLSSAADALKSASATSFLSKFSAGGLPQFALDSATGKVTSFADTLDGALSGVTSNSTSVANLAFSIRNLKATASDLINTPSLLSSKMSSAMSLLKNALGFEEDSAAGQIVDYGARASFAQYASIMSAFGSGDMPIPPRTDTRVQEQDNLDALNDHTQMLALADAALSATDLSFTSTADAAAIRDALTDKIDDLAEATSDDNVYIALHRMRAAVTRAVPPPAEDLASISKIILNESTNSLALAYDLYESVENEQDIIDRNEISHPGFLPGGRELEVLNVG